MPRNPLSIRPIRRALHAALLCLALARPASAQQEYSLAAPILTLDEAITLALKGNYSVANATLAVTKSGASVNALKTHRLPILNLDGNANYSILEQPFTVPGGAFGDYPVIGPIPGQDTTIGSIDGFFASASVGVSQPLLQLYRTGLLVDQARVEDSISGQGLRARQQDVVKSVKSQYYEILKTENTLQATMASIAFYRELVKLVDNYVKQDVAQEYELLDTQARLARAEHNARTQKNALITQKERLNNLMGRDTKTPFRVSEEPPAARAGYPSMADAESIAIAQRPDVQEKILKLKQAETGARITRADYIPSLNLVMQLTQLFNVGFVPPTNWIVGLQMRWDIWDWGRKGNDLTKKKADIAQAANDLDDTRAQVTIEVDSRLRELEEAQEMVKVTEISQAAATEKLRVLTNQYKQQAVLLKDVLQAESELAEANTQHADAILSAWNAQAQLDKALGQT
jgi:outer membrane protein